jgi:putative oxygen-independent coproporphyrinogen III oxidase
MGPYVQAMGRELASFDPLPSFSTVFFGGGTPSLLSPSMLEAVLGHVELAPGAEITLEANPEDITAARLKEYREIGINRISLGVQSTDPAVLAGLGRRQSPLVAERALGLVAAADFESYSIDLIYGGAGEDETSWMASLQLAIEFEVPHVSAYALTVEDRTPLARHPERHPNPDDQAERYLVAEAVLSSAGLEWYEVSNWSRPGHECRHNLGYWLGFDYLGIGVGAHSYGGGRRWWNGRSLRAYLGRGCPSGRPVGSGIEELNEVQRCEELLQLLLRTKVGVPGSCIHDPEGHLDGLLEPASEGRLRLTATGRLLASEVAVRVVVPDGLRMENLSDFVRTEASRAFVPGR